MGRLLLGFWGMHESERNVYCIISVFVQWNEAAVLVHAQYDC